MDFERDSSSMLYRYFRETSNIYIDIYTYVLLQYAIRRMGFVQDQYARGWGEKRVLTRCIRYNRCSMFRYRGVR